MLHHASFGPGLRYAYYLMSTLTFRTYGSWKNAGQPNPFLGRPAPRQDTCRDDITLTFEEQFKPRTRSRLYGSVSRHIKAVE